MPPSDRPLTGERLRAFRDWLSLTHADVACILGFTERTVAQYEAAGAPEWVRYALLGWAVVVHGSSPRAAARHLGFPWEHFPLPPGSPPDDAVLAQLGAPLDAGPEGVAGAAGDEPDDGPDALEEGDDSDPLKDGPQLLGRSRGPHA
jgi:hypothetical protein